MWYKYEVVEFRSLSYQNNCMNISYSNGVLSPIPSRQCPNLKRSTIIIKTSYYLLVISIYSIPDNYPQIKAPWQLFRRTVHTGITIQKCDNTDTQYPIIFKTASDAKLQNIHIGTTLIPAQKPLQPDGLNVNKFGLFGTNGLNKFQNKGAVMENTLLGALSFYY